MSDTHEGAAFFFSRNVCYETSLTGQTKKIEG
jgi:hypothetical protein